MVWTLVWMALVALGLLMFLASRLPAMNPPQCPSSERSMPDGSRCIIGANFGSGLLWLFSIGLMVVAGVATLITPPTALLVRAIRARRAGRSPAGPSHGGGAPTSTQPTPDWAGRHPYGPPVAVVPAPDTNQMCRTSMITGITAVGFLVLCALLSAPLGVVAVITGTFGLSDLKGRRSEGRRQAVVGISCGVGCLLVPTAILLWLVLTG